MSDREPGPGHPKMPRLQDEPDRRTFLFNGVMVAGLAVSYATALGFGARYLFPANRERSQKLLVGLRAEMPPGSATPFTTPSGQTVNIVHGSQGFKALSDVCPHLGCKVYWDSVGSEFVCPCHNGHFDADGAPVSGPPADMGAGLSTFDIVEDGDLIFLDLKVTT